MVRSNVRRIRAVVNRLVILALLVGSLPAWPAQAAVPVRPAMASAQTPAAADAETPPVDTDTATAAPLRQYLPWIAGGEGGTPAVTASVVEPAVVTATTPITEEITPALDAETMVEPLAGTAQAWFLPLIMRSDAPAALDLLVTPTLGTAPLTTHLTATLGGAPVLDSELHSFVWHFSDGEMATGASASHTFATPGVYTVTLTTNRYPVEQRLARTVTVYDRSQFSVGQVDAAGGVVTTHEGDLWLDFAPGAVSEPYAVFIRQIDLTRVTTDTVDGAPQLEVPGFGLPFRQISLQAVRLSDSTWLTNTVFSAPVTLTHVYSEAVVDQLLPESLHFVYANPESGQFEPIPSTVDLDAGSVRAMLSHFSDYGVAGDQAAWQTPTLGDAEVNLAKGQSSYGYALPLPGGAGGLAPQVNLSYNSGQPNSMAGPKNTDGGWVGVGWTLDLGHMTLDQLSLNGVSGKLHARSDGFYYVEEDPGLRIQRFDQPLPASGGVRGVHNAYRWEVTDQSGTVYYFGKDETGLGSVPAYRKDTPAGCEHRITAYKLAKIVDAQGNTLTIDYTEVPTPRHCGGDEPPVIAEAYPHFIRYTTNAAANDSHAEYVVEFVVTPKEYRAVESAVGDGNHRLTQIHVWYYPPEGGAPQRIRTVQFAYDVNSAAKQSLLQALTLVGVEEGATLPALQFGYVLLPIVYHGMGEFRREFLAQVQNGYGGEVQFAYAQEGGNARYQVVRSRTLSDAITTSTSTTTYTYKQPNLKLRQHCTSRTADGECNDHVTSGGFGEFDGFARVEVSDPLDGRQVHEFDNKRESLSKGREVAAWVYDPNGNLYQAVQNQWLERRTPKGIRFATLGETRSYTCFGQSQGSDLTPCLPLRTVYAVDDYGNPTQETYYDANGQPHHLSVHELEQHPVRWLWRPLAERVYQGDQPTPANQLAATVLHYADERWMLPALTRTWAGTGEQGQARYLDLWRGYDAYGNVVEETTFNRYGSEGVIANEDPRTTTTQYDQGLLPVQVTNPLRQTVRTTYDYRFQAPLRITDANGATTTTHYDSFGRLVRVDLPLCAEAVKAEYGDAVYGATGQPYYERLRQRTDVRTGGNPVYNDLYVFYSGTERKLQAQQNGDHGDTLLTAVAYDAKGRLVQSGVPYSVAAAPGVYQAPTWAAGQTTTEYDALDRPLRVIAPDGSVTRSEYGWDTTGDGAAPTLRLLTRSFDANGHRKDQVADEWGNLIRVREYSGDGMNQPYQLYGELAYTYDIQNRLVAVRDAAGNTTQLDYDLLGRKTRMVDPDMGAWHYTYDPLGNLIAQTDALGVVTRLVYDALNRLTHKAYELPAGSAAAATPATRYVYDQLPGGVSVPNGIGRRVQMDDGAGSVTWQYDLQGRVMSEARTFSGAYAQLANTQDSGAYLTRYAYNAADWVTAVTYPDGEVVTTGYTRRGLVQWQAGSMVGDIVSDTTYNALGQMTSQTTGDGLTTTYEYYPAHLGNHRLLQMRVGEGELHLAYTYDKVGNINAIYDASRGVMGERIAYRYDHLDRLVSAKNEGGALAGYTLAYEYDAVGNLTARSAAGQAMHYHYLSVQPHAVSHVGDDRYTYDANGNMVTRTEDGVTYSQHWNAFNKLAQVRWQRDGHGCNIQFIYDGDGNRLLKVTGQADQETTTYYAGRMFEKQFNTTINRLGESVPSGASGNADAVCTGSTSGVTDYGFTGQRNEAGFGLMDFNARYYSPRLGRFISPDSIVPDPTTTKGFNRYMYGDGNPVKFSDPSGHFSEDQISLLCRDCQSWDDVAAYYGVDAADLLKQELVTFGSIVLAGTGDAVTDQYALVLRGEYDGHQDRFRIGVWDLQNNREVGLSDVLAHERFTVWSTDTTLREGGYTYTGIDRGFLEEGSAERWASPTQRGRIDFETINPPGAYTRFRTYYNLNGGIVVDTGATALGLGWKTIRAVFSSTVDLANSANEVTTNRPWYDSVYPMLYTGNEWTGAGTWNYFTLWAPQR